MFSILKAIIIIVICVIALSVWHFKTYTPVAQTATSTLTAQVITTTITDYLGKILSNLMDKVEVQVNLK